VKYAWIDAQRRDYPLPDMCEVLTVSISGYRAWRRGGKPDRTRLSDPQALALLKSIHAEVRGAYGSRRMHRELQGRGHRIGLRRVERLMREHGIRARHKRRFKATTDSKHSMPVAPNLLARNFTPVAPNRVWTGDITYIQTAEGWLYLAIVLDLFNREIVGWSIKPRMTADIVTDALTMAWFRRKPGPGVVFHSDRGSQYASQTMTARLAAYGMTASMSRKGNCWDNAPSESFFNSLKNETGSRHHLRDASRCAGRPVRVHRGVLQPESPPLHAGLQLAGSVPCGLDQQACRSAIQGGMRATGWKVKFDGHLNPSFKRTCLRQAA
jgi:transposase InsO family protein